MARKPEPAGFAKWPYPAHMPSLCLPTLHLRGSASQEADLRQYIYDQGCIYVCVHTYT